MNTAKKNIWLSMGCYDDMLSRYNPFGFKSPDGASMAFKNYGEAYLFTLRKLVEEFPRGYIDLVLFIHKMTQIPIHDCSQVAKRFKNLKMSEGVITIKFWLQDTNSKEEFQKIMQSLHLLSDTPFNAPLYNHAWERFLNS